VHGSKAAGASYGAGKAEREPERKAVRETGQNRRVLHAGADAVLHQQRTGDVI